MKESASLLCDLVVLSAILVASRTLSKEKQVACKLQPHRRLSYNKSVTHTHTHTSKVVIAINKITDSLKLIEDYMDVTVTVFLGQVHIL